MAKEGVILVMYSKEKIAVLVIPEMNIDPFADPIVDKQIEKGTLLIFSNTRLPTSYENKLL
jgi:hypothetical protein